MEEQLKQEKETGKAWQAQIKRRETNLIAVGVDPKNVYGIKYRYKIRKGHALCLDKIFKEKIYLSKIVKKYVDYEGIPMIMVDIL